MTHLVPLRRRGRRAPPRPRRSRSGSRAPWFARGSCLVSIHLPTCEPHGGRIPPGVAGPLLLAQHLAHRNPGKACCRLGREPGRPERGFQEFRGQKASVAGGAGLHAK